LQEAVPRYVIGEDPFNIEKIVNRMFDRVAGRYDTLNSVMTAGLPFTNQSNFIVQEGHLDPSNRTEFKLDHVFNDRRRVFGRYSLLDANVYTFLVHPDASKPEIHDAVEAIFGVKVLKVNTLNRKGKRKRNLKTFGFGSRPDTKRAIVTLAEGESIDLFQG
jgi:large subunit ribosomal protein L23